MLEKTIHLLPFIILGLILGHIGYLVLSTSIRIAKHKRLGRKWGAADFPEKRRILSTLSRTPDKGGFSEHTVYEMKYDQEYIEAHPDEPSPIPDDPSKDPNPMRQMIGLYHEATKPK